MTIVTDNNKPAQQPLPLRGVAMILIAVAVLLAGWGIYTAVSGLGGDSQQQAAPAVTPSKSTAAAAQPSQQPTAQPLPQDTPPTASPQQPTSPQQPQQPASPQQPQQPAIPQQATVHVLNNSTIQGLAARAGDRLHNAGYTIGHVGNYADTVVPQNTVYFSDNEAQARELAAEIGGVAVPRPATLPVETQRANSLVVVLATDF